MKHGEGRIIIEGVEKFCLYKEDKVAREFKSQEEFLTFLSDAMLVLGVDVHDIKDIKDVKGVKEDKECEDAKACSICMDQDKTNAFFPCGHLCACKGCAETIMKLNQQCPICRKECIGQAFIYQ